ncbi:XTP/dITP diphosphohydrolase [Frigoribacterium sp. PvP120]|uniref:MazG nucleotide pyrophosphohydrolase domain-containing protein n=1 Tax=unclassified Frigoribacterium TaxID=2627005 RepID=UPI001AE0EDD5|nr:MazG nucleotide pyrophosphohydrolase domain-containing protein [Frigoribacterium sp. PvP121]MBP1242594.1 XTP/dITP diphosphohydrolase [Frigoribacterium sp. PvP121]
MTDGVDGRAGVELAALVRVVEALLADEGGCEWNRAQTPESLVTYLVEESSELVEAIESGAPADRREELGDVLYQVVLHAAIVARAPAEGFDLADVVRDVAAKTVRRHPHVFAGDEAADVDDIVRLWSAAKAREKADRRSAYDGVPLGLPALARAQKVESRRRSTGQVTPPGAPVDGDDGLDVELAWGRELLARVDAATAEGLDAERALRRAVREREQQLRAGEAPRP